MNIIFPSGDSLWRRLMVIATGFGFAILIACAAYLAGWDRAIDSVRPEIDEVKRALDP